MPDDSVKVTIVADTAGAQASLKAASVAMGQTKTDAQLMAQALLQTGNDMKKAGAVFLELKEAATAAAAAETAVGSGAAAAAIGVNTAAAAATEGASAVGGLRVATSGAIQEYIRLGHEVMQGNFSRIPGSVVVLASRMGGLQSVIASLTPAMYAAGAGALAFAAGLTAIALNASHAQEVLQAGRDAFSFKGIAASDGDLALLTAQLRALPGVSTEAASKIQHIFANAGLTIPVAKAMADMLPEVMRGTGDTAEQAAKSMSEEWAKAMEKSPAPEEAAREFFGKYAQAIASMAQANAPSIAEALAQAGGGTVPLGMLDTSNAEQAKKEARDVAAAIKNAATEIQISDAAAAASATKEEKTRGDSYRTLMDIIRQSNATAAAAISKAREADAAAEKAGTERIATAREQVSEIAADETKSASQRLAAEANVWRQLIAGDQITADQRKEVQRDLNQSIVQMNREQEAAAKEAADQQTRDGTEAYRQEMALIKSSDDESLAAIKAAHSTSRASELQAEAAYWRQIIALTRAGTQQQIEAIKQLGAVTQQITTEQAATWQQAERQLTESFTGPATRAFDTMVSGMFNRTQSWSQTTKKAFDQMAESFIEDVAKMIAEWLAFQALTAMGSGGSAVASAFGMTGGPLETLFGGLLGGGGAAALGGGGGAGAITDFAGLAMFDSGTMSVPQDMMAMVHQGEMIIPADASAAIRGGSASIGGVATAGGANFNMGITAIDARSVAALFNNPTFTRMLTNLVARGSNLNPSLA